MPYPTTPYLFENLLAVGSVNLIAGMSGIGKTRFVFQLMEEIEQRGTFLRIPAVSPVSITYFACDRTLMSIHRTLNSMNCELSSPIVSVRDLVPGFELRLPDNDEVKGSNLIIIDGLDCLVSRLIDSHEVGRLLFRCTKLALDNNAAMLGILGTAKVKQGEGYEHPRERIIGSSYWARLSEDILLISPTEDSDKENRTIDVLPRNSANYKMNFIIEDGRLILEETCRPDKRDYAILTALPTEFTTEQAEDVGEAMKLSRATIFRTLKRLDSQGFINKVQHGHYIKVRPN